MGAYEESLPSPETTCSGPDSPQALSSGLDCWPGLELGLQDSGGLATWQADVQSHGAHSSVCHVRSNLVGLVSPANEK